jgi:hypothetical protein
MIFLCGQSEYHPWVNLAKLGYKLIKYESKKCLNILLFLATYLNTEISEIMHFFWNFCQILAIENLKKTFSFCTFFF